MNDEDRKAEETEKHKAIPELSVDTRLLFEKLQTVEVGETLTYADMSEIMGRDAQENRHIVTSARRKALREEGFVFECVQNVGLKRMSDSEILSIGDQARRKVRREARRSVKKILCSDYNKLTDEEKIIRNTHLSHLGLIHEVSKDKQVKKIESAVKNAEAQLPLNKTLELFGDR